MGQLSFFKEVDQKKTQQAVVDALERYRFYKHMYFEERETSVTASYGERVGGSSNSITDQTAEIAIYNVDEKKYRHEFCENVERIVESMPRLERLLIKERYLTVEYEYITDLHVYTFVFDPPISEPTYSKIRWRAFMRLATKLQLVVKKDGD
ncbi:ArpU family phage packaging/lysis transcriptional regulator [Paenibacillus sp. Marseille-Q4541]|uniref:ArpU family phage packaging/lysis transcriptional regulator n=1 Tax=Paenibacillus sp. Marseille-Q4541 TaxID=2831522 RepID=UPI001BA63576